MAANKNIEAAISHYGSDACWTIPGVVEWSQNSMAPAPSLSPAEAAALRQKHLGIEVSAAIMTPETEPAAPQSFESTAVPAEQLQHIGGVAVSRNTQTATAA